MGRVRSLALATPKARIAACGCMVGIASLLVVGACLIPSTATAATATADGLVASGAGAKSAASADATAAPTAAPPTPTLTAAAQTLPDEGIDGIINSSDLDAGSDYYLEGNLTIYINADVTIRRIWDVDDKYTITLQGDGTHTLTVEDGIYAGNQLAMQSGKVVVNNDLAQDTADPDSRTLTSSESLFGDPAFMGKNGVYVTGGTLMVTNKSGSTLGGIGIYAPKNGIALTGGSHVTVDAGIGLFSGDASWEYGGEEPFDGAGNIRMEQALTEVRVNGGTEYPSIMTAGLIVAAGKLMVNASSPKGKQVEIYGNYQQSNGDVHIEADASRTVTDEHGAVHTTYCGALTIFAPSWSSTSGILSMAGGSLYADNTSGMQALAGILMHGNDANPLGTAGTLNFTGGSIQAKGNYGIIVCTDANGIMMGNGTRVAQPQGGAPYVVDLENATFYSTLAQALGVAHEDEQVTCIGTSAIAPSNSVELVSGNQTLNNIALKNIFTDLTVGVDAKFTAELDDTVGMGNMSNYMEISEEQWIAGNNVIRSGSPSAPRNNLTYSYQITLKAKTGYQFSAAASVYVDGGAKAATRSVSTDGKTITISGIVSDKTFGNPPASTVVSPSISSAVVSKVPDQEYTSYEVKPVPASVVLDGVKLVEGTDYSISYTNNVDVGTATVTATGLGRYIGTCSTTFNIYHTDTLRGFKDLKASAWYLNEGGQFAISIKTHYLDYVLGRGIMRGKTATKFDPEGSVTRAELAIVLYRLKNGVNAANGADKNTTKLKDVKNRKWYTRAINWCVQNKYMTGYTSGKKKGRFGPNDKVTREQMATVIARYCTANSYLYSSYAGANIKEIKDRAKISKFALLGVAYCSTYGLMNGQGSTKVFDPKSYLTRAQMAKVVAVASRNILYL